MRTQGEFEIYLICAQRTKASIFSIFSAKFESFSNDIVQCSKMHHLIPMSIHSSSNCKKIGNADSIPFIGYYYGNKMSSAIIKYTLKIK